ncbi:MAG: response regulator [Polyangiaceae bacterium]
MSSTATDGAPDTSGSPAKAPSSSTPTRKPLTSLHVLVVDDQEDARDLVATVLEDAGARVTQAESAAAALEVLARDSVSVIVSDVGMPIEDGYTFIRKVRETSSAPETSSTPALALTAFARAEDRARALEAGFQEHVAKPVDLRRLVELVSSLARR